jgi:hypothetical protein
MGTIEIFKSIYNNWIAFFSLTVSILAMIVSVISLRYSLRQARTTALKQVDTQLAKKQSIDISKEVIGSLHELKSELQILNEFLVNTLTDAKLHNRSFKNKSHKDASRADRLSNAPEKYLRLINSLTSKFSLFIKTFAGAIPSLEMFDENHYSINTQYKDPTFNHEVQQRRLVKHRKEWQS